ncbi:MAG: protease HtpX [Bacteriovoracaceae bacterium]|nr:protease HtpX [Bacteriovoracaceae bacterium]
MWFKRIGFFALVNIGILLMLSIIMSVFGIDQYLAAHGGGYQGLFIVCLLWGTGGAFISLWISKWMAKKFYGLQIVTGTDRDYSDLVMMVHGLARKAGLSKMPEVGIYDSPGPNAFATGPSKNNSLVAVSTGLLQSMSRDEVEGVLGHEISHITNGDMVTMTLVQGVLNAFVMFFARIVAEIINNVMRDDNGRGGLGFFGYYAVVMFMQFVFGIIAALIANFFSRYREYKADSGSAGLCGKYKMISALEALKKNYHITEQEKPVKGMASFQISSKMSFVEFFSTHPSLDKRIAALKNS